MIIGSMTALITPFKDGKVDELSYEELIKRQIRNGIEVVVPVGTTGESATLTHNEHKKCIEIAISSTEGTNTKVIAGAGSNSTIEAIDLAKFAESAGADGILSVTPYYNKPTQNGLYQHYKAIASAIKIPFMMYNVPSRTGVDLRADTAIKLFNDVENIYAIKEATGSLERCVELLSKEKKLVVISGDDAINYPIIANGGKGVISVTANLLPNKIAELVKFGLESNFAESKRVNDELYPLNSNLFIESNPIPIKAIMYLAGLIKTLEYRLPLTPPSNETMKKLEKALENIEVPK